MGFPKASRIENVFAQTILDSSYTDAELKIKVSATGSGKLTAKLLDEKKQEIASSDADIKSDGVTELSIQVKHRQIAFSPDDVQREILEDPAGRLSVIDL